MKYKWLLFDADGTLFDYDGAEARALEMTFAQIGLGFEPEFVKIYRRINEDVWKRFEQGRITQGRLRLERFELFLGTINVVYEAEVFSKQYLRNLAACSHLIEGVEEVIKFLAGKVGLVIITNGLKEVQRPRLEKSVIGYFFSDIIISEEVGASKPDKQIFDAAFNRMKDPGREEVLIIGDSLAADIQGGNNYGIDTCWFNPDKSPCDQDVTIDYEIHSPGELLSIIAE